MGMSAFSDNIRGPIKGNIDPKTDLMLGLEELAILNIHSDPFTQGYMLKISIPKSYQRYENSYAISLYSNVYPKPSVNNRYYTGTREFREILPTKDEVLIYFPCDSTNNKILKDFALSRLLREDEDPLIFTFLPLMKGLPEDAGGIRINLSIEKISKNKGAVVFDYSKVREEYRNSLNIQINGNTYYSPDAPIMLDNKEYTAIITSPYHEKTVYEFEVPKGETLTIPIEITEKKPVISFDVPEGTSVIIDGTKYSDKLEAPLSFEEGEHSFFFTLGDHQVSRSLYLQGGKEYKISIFLDILIEEAKIQ